MCCVRYGMVGVASRFFCYTHLINLDCQTLCYAVKIKRRKSHKNIFAVWISAFFPIKMRMIKVIFDANIRKKNFIIVFTINL